MKSGWKEEKMKSGWKMKSGREEEREETDIEVVLSR